jgi:hypothetical protein
MTKLEKLEREVGKLSRAEMAAFRTWFRKYDSDEWDRQIEEDIQSGKLESLAEEAVSASRTGLRSSSERRPSRCR